MRDPTVFLVTMRNHLIGWVFSPLSSIQSKVLQ